MAAAEPRVWTIGGAAVCRESGCLDADRPSRQASEVGWARHRPSPEPRGSPKGLRTHARTDGLAAIPEVRSISACLTRHEFLGLSAAYGRSDDAQPASVCTTGCTKQTAVTCIGVVGPTHTSAQDDCGRDLAICRQNDIATSQLLGDRKCTRAGWPRVLPPGAPTDPDVRTLAHPVPLMVDSPCS